MSRQIYLIGFPLGYSWSPAMQQAALTYSGLNVRYELRRVSYPDLFETIRSFRNPEVLGFNVTMPYKEVVLPLLDSISPEAHAIGAVNTVINHNGQLHGHNTDVYGAKEVLRRIGSARLGVAIMGAGGAARSVVTALSDPTLRPLTIDVVNRGSARAESLLALADRLGLKARAHNLGQLRAVLSTTDMVINCATDSSALTTIPLRNRVWDLNYGSKALDLKKHCSGHGVPYEDGSAMLLFQGARAFELWTNLAAPTDIMRGELLRQGGDL